MIRKAIILIIIAVAASSCCRYDIDEVLLMRNDISMTWKGKEQMAYDPLNCQLSHNHETNTFRVYDDALANWFMISCQTRPSHEGQELTADVSWTTHNDTKHEKGLTFRVEKIDQTGQVWMWNKSKNIGIVIKNL